MNAEFAHLFELSLTDRLKLVEDLWDSIAKDQSKLPIAEWKVAELLQRKERFDKNPQSGRSWEEVKERARKRHDRQS